MFKQILLGTKPPSFTVQPIGSWNVSAVTNMQAMFSNASSFNHNIGSWNLGKVTNTSYMFSNASSFNQDIGAWNMKGHQTSPPIGDWNVSSVTNMSNLLYEATSFNRISSSFNQPNIGSNGYGYMFYVAAVLRPWDVSNTTNMQQTFVMQMFLMYRIGLTNMSWLFSNASNFNQDISDRRNDYEECFVFNLVECFRV